LLPSSVFDWLMFSGEDVESSRLEESTWTDSNVCFISLFSDF